MHFKKGSANKALDKQQHSRDISKQADPTAKIVDQAGLDIKYQEELRRHLDRKDALRDGLEKSICFDS
jgi:hypothetical protein